MTTSNLPEGLARYLADRDEERTDAVRQTLSAMTGRERALVREAALMGYVRGELAGRLGDHTIPPDSAVLAEVIDACLTFEGLYPTINLLARRAGTETTR